MKFIFQWLLATGLLLSGCAYAEDPTPIGDFKDWSVHSYGDGRAKYCYAISWPKKQDSANTNRKPYLLVAHQPGKGIRNQVELNAGTIFLPNVPVSVKIGEKQYEMYSVGDGAWTPTSVLDNRMVSDMRQGRQFVVSGKSGGGKAIKDRYSLLGFTAAIKEASKNCR